MNELHTIFVRLGLRRRWARVLIGSCAAGFYEKKFERPRLTGFDANAWLALTASRWLTCFLSPESCRSTAEGQRVGAVKLKSSPRLDLVIDSGFTIAFLSFFIFQTSLSTSSLSGVLGVVLPFGGRCASPALPRKVRQEAT